MSGRVYSADEERPKRPTMPGRTIHVSVNTAPEGDSKTASPAPRSVSPSNINPMSLMKLRRAVLKASAYSRLTKKDMRKEYQRNYGHAGLSLSLAKKRGSSRSLLDQVNASSDEVPAPQRPAHPFAPRPGAAESPSGRAKRPIPLSGTQRRLLRANSRMTVVPDFKDKQESPVPQATSRTAKAYYMLEEMFTRPRGKTCGLIFFAILQVVLGAVLLTFGDLGNGNPTDFMLSLWESWTYVAGG